MATKYGIRLPATYRSKSPDRRCPTRYRHRPRAVMAATTEARTSSGVAPALTSLAGMLGDRKYTGRLPPSVVTARVMRNGSLIPKSWSANMSGATAVRSPPGSAYNPIKDSMTSVERSSARRSPNSLTTADTPITMTA